MSAIEGLLERFRRGPELVAMAITGAAGTELDYTPAPGRWSVRQLLCHLADSEIVAADRFRRILAEDNPTLVSYDEKAWAANLDYTHRKTVQALETFRHLRGINYELLKALPEVAYSRPGTHSELGPLTLLDNLVIYVEHTEKHSEQIRSVRQSYKQFKNRS